MRRLTDESRRRRAPAPALGQCGVRWGRSGRPRVRDVEFLRRRMQCGARLLPTDLFDDDLDAVEVASEGW
jgi:hypothetical protein